MNDAATITQDQHSTAHVFERLLDSQPILDMLSLLEKTGRSNFHENAPWEVCLCALILQFEPHCKLQRILEALPYHQDKSTPMDEMEFLNAMAHLGYACCPADTSLDKLDTRLLPAVFIPASLKHGQTPTIILKRASDGLLQFYDPVSKLVSSVSSSFNKNGAVWFFRKYDENSAPTSRFMRQGTGYEWFRALMGRFRGTFAQVMVAGLILNIIALGTPLFIMLVYDRVIAAGAIATLPMLAVGAFIAIGFEWRLRQIRSKGLSWLGGRLDNVVGNRIFAHLIGLSPHLIEKASVAAQIARIKTFESVRDFFSGSVFLSLLEAPFVFISIAAVALIAGNLVFVPLFVATGYLALFMLIRHKIKVSIRLAAKSSSARQQFTIETFEKLKAIRGHGLRQKWQEKFRHLSGREMMSHFHLGWLGMVAETLAHSLTVVAAVATVGFGVHMIWEGQLTAGALVATMILVWRILTPLYSVCTMIPRLEQLRNSIAQVNMLMDIETEAEEAKSYSRLPRLKGNVSFHNTSFSYGDDSGEVFHDVSFDAQSGDLVVLTGANGTGKASILHLIQGLYRAKSGTVRIDGFDIRQLDAPDLRRQIAYVPRQPHFFKGSVIENMRLANPLSSEEEVMKALQLADAWDDVNAWEDGINTQIGSENSILTSNLAARLSLARAYLHPAPVLLIDDLPNALLSSKTGSNLMEYLIRAKGIRTVILCSFRDDFMKLADTIIWLRGMDDPISGAAQDVLNIMEQQQNQEVA